MSGPNKRRKTLSTSDARSESKEWEVFEPSEISVNTINPIRAIVDKMKIPKSTPEKPLIPLSIGDPTKFGNLHMPANAFDAVEKMLRSEQWNGYGPSIGFPQAREAVAKKFGTPTSPLTADDVILASGCSGALTLAIQAFGKPGCNILVPRPGFSLYATIAGHTGYNIKHYNLLPEKQWECDINHMEEVVDSKTVAIVVNNPSNPCGANYSKKHLLDILDFAERKKIPIIADEIYGYMTFKGETFYPMASLTSTVPIIAAGGLAKQYLVPGWRVGWITIHDRNNLFKETREALSRLSQLILGPNTLIQACIPNMLHETPDSYLPDLMATLERQANLLIDTMSKIDGLECIKPQGAMYLMTKIHFDKFKGLKNDMDFAQKLMDEELLFVLPGSCFEAPGFVRFVFCAPDKILKDACQRLEAFCKRYHV